MQCLETIQSNSFQLWQRGKYFGLNQMNLACVWTFSKLKVMTCWLRVIWWSQNSRRCRSYSIENTVYYYLSASSKLTLLWCLEHFKLFHMNSECLQMHFMMFHPRCSFFGFCASVWLLAVVLNWLLCENHVHPLIFPKTHLQDHFYFQCVFLWS